MPKKVYSESNKKPESVNEPEMAYGWTIDAIRMEVIRETLSIENVNILNKALDYLRQLKQQAAPKPPCQYTVEELRAHVLEAIEDVKAGRVYTSEELAKEMETW